MTEATARRKVKTWATEHGCEVETRKYGEFETPEVELIAPDGKLFKDELTGLLDFEWLHLWERIEAGEAALMDEVTA